MSCILRRIFDSSTWILTTALLAHGLAAPPADAASITYQAVDLPDTTPGEDLWEYRYTVDLKPEAAFPIAYTTGFSVEFQLGLYSNLEAELDPTGTWDPITLQPDAAIPAPGLFDVQPLVDIPGPVPLQSFGVQFVWLGGAARPGAQAFQVYTFDPDYTELFSGTTTPAPEPGRGLLFGIAVAAVLVGARARRGER